MRAIGQQAPHAKVRFLAEPAQDTPDLARGHIDLEIGATIPSSPAISHLEVGTDRMAMVHRVGHRLDAEELTVERFAEATHIAISRRGRSHGPIDEVLATFGLRREVLATLSNSSSALDLVAATDLVTVVPERLCRARSELRGLRGRDIPFTLAPATVVMTWHQRFAFDPAHTWLRGRVEDALRHALAEGRPPRGGAAFVSPQSDRCGKSRLRLNAMAVRRWLDTLTRSEGVRCETRRVTTDRLRHRAGSPHGQRLWSTRRSWRAA